ncbi:hypothetical protein JK621_10070 [Serratia plymuthica]|uniref:hypothetical protein n=1 Tax=Serratia plymuthica TaxID=82996 RepID=UPI001BAF0412|nr:hypothetical protein [Serratia plymuthica]QUY50463.1 hypothetical protein JK621_10070 [Serratia plymuthica]
MMMLIVGINSFILRRIDFIMSILPFIAAFPLTPTAAVAAGGAAVAATGVSAHNFFIRASAFK